MDGFTHRPDTALTHELAHLIDETVFPGARDAASRRFRNAGNAFHIRSAEAYPLEVENEYRAAMDYEPRLYYASVGDVNWPDE